MASIHVSETASDLTSGVPLTFNKSEDVLEEAESNDRLCKIGCLSTANEIPSPQGTDPSETSNLLDESGDDD